MHVLNMPVEGAPALVAAGKRQAQLNRNQRCGIDNLKNEKAISRVSTEIQNAKTLTFINQENSTRTRQSASDINGIGA